MPTKERRKEIRVGLAIPLRVQGFLADGGTWEEITNTVDVSQGGACFPLTHEAELGQVLLLSLPMPKRLRQYDLNDDDLPRLLARARGAPSGRAAARRGHVLRQVSAPRLPGAAGGAVPAPLRLDRQRSRAPGPARAARPRSPGRRRPLPAESGPDLDPPSLDTLVGRHGSHSRIERRPKGLPRPVSAPLPDDSGAGYTPPALTAPSTIPKGRAGVPPAPVPGAPTPQFQPTARGAERPPRRPARGQLFVNFTIQLVDEWGAVLQEELTVADNVAKGGARVMTSLGFQVGDILLLQEAGGGFATRAEVRGITRVQPTVDRLHLRFLDRQAPERLLRP